MSIPRRLWLFRAGESVWAADRRLHGRADLPMSADGRATVMADLELLVGCDVGTVLHPSDEAATETARMLVETLAARRVTAKARVETALAEPDLGVLEGMTHSELTDRFPTRARQLEDDPAGLIPPEGEAIVAAQRRLLDTVSERIRRWRGRDLALVLHPMALGMLRCAFAGRPLDAMWAVLAARPRIERYLLPVDAHDRLRELADST